VKREVTQPSLNESIGERDRAGVFDPAKLRLNKSDKYGYPNEDGST
jgi:hypothetical protein